MIINLKLKKLIIKKKLIKKQEKMILIQFLNML